MTDKEAIEYGKKWDKAIESRGDTPFSEARQFLNLAIEAIKRDSKIDDITLHWNDEKSTFVAACNAFEKILKVYGRGVEAGKETDNVSE